MNIILLSGGSGKRLWPLSNEIRSKQFIKIFKNEDGNYESMLQRMYNQICNIDKNSRITIATANNQVPQIRNQLNDSIGISVEPARRDTFPAIVLATIYLNEVMKVDENESVVVCPVDPYVDKDYFEKLNEMYELSQKSDSNLILMGINPTYPSEKFGYIIPKTHEQISKVKSFKEKPTTTVAKEYIRNNGLWNGGVFAYKIKYLLKKAHELIDFTDYQDLYNKYEKLEKISFDYAVVEKEENISVVRFNGKWEDLGTWNALVEKIPDKTIGNVMLSNTSNNVNVINELDIPVIGIGLQDIIISCGLDGILVTNKMETDSLKKYVGHINNVPRYIENEWGNYKTLDVTNNIETIKIFINKNKNYIYKRDKTLEDRIIVLSGNGNVIYNDIVVKIYPLSNIDTQKDNIIIEAKEDLELLLIRKKEGKY